MSFAGKRVIALESRRAVEMAELIRRQGGDPFVAPSMREAPIENNPEAFDFAERLLGGGFDMVIFLTGVGTRALVRVIGTRYPVERLAEALRGITLVARGPKPAAALREMQTPATILVPEPNTWRELLVAIRDRKEHNIAVQEYGRPNPELIGALRARGAEVTPVRVYQWDLPEDTGPLREAVRRIAAGEADVILFTTAIQVVHLFRVAGEMGLRDEVERKLPSMVISSIGPATTEALEHYDLHPALEPSHPKMGILVKETAEWCGGATERQGEGATERGSDKARERQGDA